MSKSSTTTVKVAPHVMQSLTVLMDGPTTRPALGLSFYHVNRLTTAGILKAQVVKGTRQVRKNMDESGKALRGRPAPLHMLTPKGRDRVRRFVKAQAA